MKRGWLVLVAFIWGVGWVYAEVHESFAKYHAAYEERMAVATSKKEVTFLTTRYDAALGKLYEQFFRAEKVLDAEAVASERNRIRALEKVVAAGVFKPAKIQPLEKEPEQPVAPSEVKLFGLKQTCSRPVFLLHAGPAILMDRENPDRGRVTFEVLRSRIIDSVESMNDGMQFNMALFWAVCTTTIAPAPLSATQENKEQFVEWIAPVNPLGSTAYLGRYSGPDASAAKSLRWPNRLNTHNMIGQPSWMYNYQVGNQFSTLFNGIDPIHWVSALIFAFEQKADVVFLVTPSLIVRRDENLKDIIDGLEAIAEEIYGENNLPEIHFFIVTKGRDPMRVEDSCRQVLKEFEGEITIIDNIEDWMTDDEKDLFDSL